MRLRTPPSASGGVARRLQRAARRRGLLRLPGGRFLAGTTGAADDRLPAYTYRLCLTTDPANAHRLTEPPPSYDRGEYVGYFDRPSRRTAQRTQDAQARAGLQPRPLRHAGAGAVGDRDPNRKTDININPRPLGFPFPEENRGYIEGDDATRQRIRQRHRDLTLGLLWFLQNDEQVPAEHRRIANGYHLPRDEFTDNDHFPFQLYVREGRRLVGEYTLTEHDMTTGSRRHEDAIAVGEFPIDSFPCRKRQPTDTQVLEGYLGMLDELTQPYEIPYRIMIPVKVENSSSRSRPQPPTCLLLDPHGAHLDGAGPGGGNRGAPCAAGQVTPRRVPVGELQRLLKAQGQIVSIPSG